MAVSERRPAPQRFRPWAKPLADLPGNQIVTYDRWSDTLFVEFYGEGRPAVSVPTALGDRDFFYLRVDPETEEIVGVQIEAFLGYAVRFDPTLWKGIPVAKLDGLTEIEAAELRRRARATVHGQADAESFDAGIARLIA